MSRFGYALHDHEFIAGERFTIADIFALGALDFGVRYLDFEIPRERPSLVRWHRAVSARPSASA